MIEIKIGKVYKFEYLNPETKLWETHNGVADLASPDYNTILLGSIAFYPDGNNEHLRNIEEFHI